VEHFDDPGTKWVIGNLKYVFEDTGEVVADRSPAVTFERLLRNPDIIRQQPTFFRRSFLEQVGVGTPSST